MNGSDAEAAGNDAAEFSRLYRTYAGDVRRFALFLSGDAALADDIVSETFIRMWNARARVDLTTVKAYLFAIARNLFVHERRQARRTAPMQPDVSDPQPDPHHQAHAREELAAVLAALQLLPEVDRSAVLMRADAGMPYEEIARALGISEAAAKVKVHRARMKLSAARQPPAAGQTEHREKP
jgi:RNA polymerase sigma-70 factor (ECF subfamily)